MPRQLTQEEVDALKQRWTDRYVRARGGRPEWDRFAGRVGRVVTVNWAGRALVDFADGGWYDLPASEECLEVVDPQEAAGKYDPAVNSAQPRPARQG